MPAQYPDAVVTPRTIENRPGVVYDANDTKTLYAEDLESVNDELVAIETELGTSPKGNFSDVKAFLLYLLKRTRYIIEENLILFLPFDDSENSIQKDLSIFGNNSSAVSGAVGADGKIGRCLSFDGIDDYVDVPHHANQLLVNGGTIECWFNAVGLGENNAGRIVDKGTNTAALAGFLFAVAANNALQFNINNGTNQVTGNNVFNLGTWVHAVVTFTAAGAVVIYVNGEIVKTGGTTGAASGITNTNAMRIGNRSGATDRSFNGLIDHLKIYNTVLTATEVKNKYLASL